MKVYIQEIESGRYFKNPFVWVEDKSAAHNFVTSLEAFDFCLQMQHGHGARVLLSFEDPHQDVCLFSFGNDGMESKPAEIEHLGVPEVAERHQELVGVG